MLQLLLPLIQTILFSTPRFSIRIKKNPQKLNVFFLVQNRRNFTTQKLTDIWYVITFVSDGVENKMVCIKGSSN
jgi:hypothetical protein